MTNIIKRIYYKFLQEKITEKYIKQYGNNVIILGANFLNNYYIVLFQNIGENKNYRFGDNYLIVENCDNPQKIYLKLYDTASEYLKSRKHCIDNICPEVFTLLLNRGLYMKRDTGIDGDNLFSLHRLNMSLYTNISGIYEVHHNNKHKEQNEISNLTPIHKDIHKKLDLMQGDEFIVNTNILHNQFKTDIIKHPKNTLANRDKNILNILYGLNIGKSVKELESKKIRKTKIYEIKKTYYYLKDFIQYLENIINMTFEEFNGKALLNWKNTYPYNPFQQISEGEFKELQGYIYSIPKFKIE